MKKAVIIYEYRWLKAGLIQIYQTTSVENTKVKYYWGH
jgi:hypothetical protein